MNAKSVQRPIGFAPSEISARVNEEVVSFHAEEAAFLWSVRNRAVGEPHYSLGDLAEVDERVEAHLDGLREAGDVGWKCCKVNLQHLGAGEVFALSAIAFGGNDRDRMREALTVGCTSAETRAGFTSALGWLDFQTASPWIGRLLEASSPLHRALGIRACAIHRQDPGAVLAAAAVDPDPTLRAVALRTIGELKRDDLRRQLLEQRRSEFEECQFRAACALALLGERAGVVELTRWFEGPELLALPALQLGLRAMAIEESREWIRVLVGKAEFARRAVISVGIVGDPASIPWLIARMQSPDVARLAGEALTMITGVDLAYHDLDEDPPESLQAEDLAIEEVLDLGYESNLPWPSRPRIEAWWRENQQAFADGTRYLAGRPITWESAVATLSTGKQRQRAAAALELAVREPKQLLFEVRARATEQQRILAAWTS